MGNGGSGLGDWGIFALVFFLSFFLLSIKHGQLCSAVV